MLCDVNELRIAVRLDQSGLIDLYAAYGFELALQLEESGYVGLGIVDEEEAVGRV